MPSNAPPGPVMLDLAGTALTAEDQDRLLHPAAGGVIFFTRNYQSPEQLAGLVAAIRAVRPSLLIATDHEGGRVQRFREGFTRLPPAARYRTADEPASAAALAGWLMAAELRAVDVDFSFAPVLDVESGISRVIGDRAFAHDPETAIRLASAFAQGMRRAGMAAVGKHFPGHGGVVEDSHFELPIDRRDLATLESRDLRPFQALIEAGIEGIMPSHVIYETVDPHPAGFSPFWLRTTLRERLGFQGAIFSDDLSMAGAAYAGGPRERARLALDAGCDMVLVCNAPEAADQVLESLAGLPADPARAARLTSLRGRFPIDRAVLLDSAEWHAAQSLIASLNASTGPA